MDYGFGLRVRRIKTEEAIRRLLDIVEKIVKWKREEREMGRDRYPIFEAIRVVLPMVGREEATHFVDGLLTELRVKKLLFKGWSQQRGVRRKVMAETRLRLLSNFRDYREKVDELTDRVFGVLQGIE